MTSRWKNAQVCKDVTRMHSVTRNASLQSRHYIKHCDWGDRGHAEEYQALSTVRLSDRHELWLTAEDRAQLPETRNAFSQAVQNAGISTCSTASLARAGRGGGEVHHLLELASASKEGALKGNEASKFSLWGVRFEKSEMCIHTEICNSKETAKKGETSGNWGSLFHYPLAAEPCSRGLFGSFAFLKQLFENLSHS